jgi:hypothetical protein
MQFLISVYIVRTPLALITMITTLTTLATIIISLRRTRKSLLVSSSNPSNLNITYVGKSICHLTKAWKDLSDSLSLILTLSSQSANSFRLLPISRGCN